MGSCQSMFKTAALTARLLQHHVIPAEYLPCHKLRFPCWQGQKINGDMQEQLAAVRAVAEPLRARLDIPPMQLHFQQLQGLDQLPQPLHTAFLQLRAAREAFGLPADIAISGVPSTMQVLLTLLWGRCNSYEVEHGTLFSEAAAFSGLQ